MKNFDKALCIISFLALLSACQEQVVPGGQITIRNDISDANYNSFTVDKVVTNVGTTTFRKQINPGEEIVIPYKHIRSLRFTRPYKDHARVYHVKCPSDLNSAISMKLISVHMNRIAGGCKLVKVGKRYPGGHTIWDQS